MATQKLTNTILDAGVLLVTWGALANGDVGQEAANVKHGDATFCVEGTFGSGGTITLKGSMDDVHYHALTDPQGNAITLTGAGIKAVTERPLYLRPECTGGDGTTTLVPYLLLARSGR